MRILYAYEVGGVEQTYNQHALDITTPDLESGLSREILLKYLKDDGAQVNDESVLSIYNESRSAYVTLRKGDFVSSDLEVRVLIRKGHSPSVHELLQKIEALEKQVHMLQKKLETRVETTAARTYAIRGSIILTAYSEIDIAMLHSSPLVTSNNGVIKSIEDSSLDFEGERRNLIEYLESRDAGCDIRFEVANTENLYELLDYKPKIIYISSQGYLVKRENGSEFVLGFEKRGGVEDMGILDEVDSDRLKKILGSASTYFQIVIFKGCYSQEIGAMLQNAGFNCVVTVHDLDGDIHAKTFVAEMCRSLIKGDFIENAFKKAVVTIEDKNKISSCCCAHRHKPNCLWMNKIQCSNKMEIHREHVPESCRCKFGSNIHSINCAWAQNFMTDYTPDRQLTDDELLSQKFVICCCSPEINHANIKFSILYNDSSILEQVLLENNGKTSIEIKSPLPAHLKPPYVEKITVGRRKQIRQLAVLASVNRCVEVIGQCGIGKTMLVKRAAQYVYERRIFKEGVVYLDFMMRTDIIFMYRYIASTLNLPSINNLNELCKALDNLDVLLIIDNIDPLLKQENSTLKETYSSLINNTTAPKFIIATQKELNFSHSEKFIVKPLKTREAAKLLVNLVDPNWKLKSDYIKHPESIESEFFDKIGTLPAAIQQIAPLFKDYSLEELSLQASGNLDNFNQHSAKDSEKTLSMSLTHVNNKLSKTSDFLKLLCYLPSGAFKINIDYLCRGTILDYMKILQLLNTEGHTLNTWFLHSDPNFEFVLVRSNVANYLETHYSNRPEFATKVIEHLAVFARALLKCFLLGSSPIGAEVKGSLFFVNAAIDYKMWSSQFPDLSDQLAEQLEKEPIKPRDMFAKIEANFWYYMNIDQLKRALGINDVIPEETAKALGEIMNCTAAIFIILGKNADALELLDRAKKCCEAFNLDKYHSMTNLTYASLLSANPNNFDKAIDLIEAAKNYFIEADDREGQAESNFLQAMIKEFRSTSSEGTLILSRRSTQTDLEGQLELADTRFRESENNLGCARAQLALAEYKLKYESNEADVLDKLENARVVFEELGRTYWEARATICLGDWYCFGKNWIKARDIYTSALNLTKRNGDRKQEIEVTEKIKKSNEMIRKKSKNVIALLKASPLVEKTNSIQRVGAVCRFPSEFRTSLKAELAETGKEVCVRFDIGSKTKLKEYLQDNCRILHIASEVPRNNCLIFEKENGVAEILTKEDLKNEIVSFQQYGVEVLVLAMPFSVQLGEFCRQELGVPHVIAFGMPDYPKDGEPIHLYLAFESAIHTFCINFYKNLVSGLTVRTSFLEAKEEMELYLDEQSREFGYLEFMGKYFEQWWEEYHRNEPVLINEISGIHDSPIFFEDGPEYPKNSSLIDMSTPRAPSNIEKKTKCFIGRQVELFNIIEALNDTPSCVHITSAEGVGKSEFVKYLGYYLNIRDKYPDGIYLLDLQGKSSLNEVYELFQKVGLAFYSSDIDPRTFLYQQRLLLILDNCDALMTQAEITFNSLLRIFLKECKLSLILTSCAQITTDDSYNIKRFALRHLNNQESYQLLALKSPKFTSQRLEAERDRPEFNQTVYEIIRECQGIPRKILIWARRLEKQDSKNISLLLSLKNMNNTASEPTSPLFEEDLPSLELVRSSTKDEFLTRSRTVEPASIGYQNQEGDWFIKPDIKRNTLFPYK